MLGFAIAGIVLSAVLAAVIAIARMRGGGSRRRGSGQGKVAVLADHRKRKASERRNSEGAPSRPQKCSYCRKPAKRITMYAEPSGTVVGVCPSCEPLARERDLMPL
ncbi:hypothetical protein [Paenibacillus sp. GYB003]|uniref:hypothetical protein n=1 Tax=Paenibacillus sp. GYB003 TaxID=2994392 RepID=UPI002F96B468